MVLDQARPLVVLCVIATTEIIVMERSVTGSEIYERGNAIVTICASGTRDSNGDRSAGITARESAIAATEEDWSETTNGTTIRQIATKIAVARRDSATTVDGLIVTIAIQRTSLNGSARGLRLSTIRSS